MKIEKFKLNAYEINSIGYFKKKKSSDGVSYEFEPYKGDVDSVLASLSKWVNSEGMIVANTLTSELNSESEYGIKNVYCYSLNEYLGNYLLTTWNETENNSNKITTLKINQKVGEAQSGSTPFGDNEKPGFPFYVWFLPNEKMFITINHVGGCFPIKPMINYIKNFMKYINPDMITIQKENLFNDESKIIYDHDPKLNLHILFNYAVKKRKNLLEYVLGNIDKIKRIHSSNRLSRTVQIDEDFIEIILRKLGLIRPEGDEPIKCNLSIEYQPDEQQIKELFLNHVDTDERIGVDIDGKTYWNKNVNFNTEINADKFLEDGKIANCQKLLKYLVDNKASILSEY